MANGGWLLNSVFCLTRLHWKNPAVARILLPKRLGIPGQRLVGLCGQIVPDFGGESRACRLTLSIGGYSIFPQQKLLRLRKAVKHPRMLTLWLSGFNQLIATLQNAVPRCSQ